MKTAKMVGSLILGAIFALSACGGDETDDNVPQDSQTEQTSNDLNRNNEVLWDALRQTECQNPAYLPTLNKDRCPPIKNDQIFGTSGGQ